MTLHFNGHCIVPFVVRNLVPFDPLSFGLRFIALCENQKAFHVVHTFMHGPTVAARLITALNASRRGVLADRESSGPVRKTLPTNLHFYTFDHRIRLSSVELSVSFCKITFDKH